MSSTYLKNVQWYRNQYKIKSSSNSTGELIELFKSKFLVVNKPHDLVYYNFSQHKTENLMDLLRDKYPFYYDPRVKGGFRVLHRLDTVCSGCLCVPLTPKSEKLGYEMFLKQKVSKYYLALVYGHIKNNNEEFSIEASIGDDFDNKGYLMTTKFDRYGNLNTSCENEKPAKTLVKVLEHGTYNSKPCSKVLLTLVTGKRHQLRVHLSYFGHPIVGDIAYGSNDFDTYRTMLHAYSFSMTINKHKIRAKAEDPFKNEIDSCWKSETIINQINF